MSSADQQQSTAEEEDHVIVVDDDEEDLHQHVAASNSNNAAPSAQPVGKEGSSSSIASAGSGGSRRASNAVPQQPIARVLKGEDATVLAESGRNFDEQSPRRFNNPQAGANFQLPSPPAKAGMMQQQDSTTSPSKNSSNKNKTSTVLSDDQQQQQEPGSVTSSNFADDNYTTTTTTTPAASSPKKNKSGVYNNPNEEEDADDDGCCARLSPDYRKKYQGSKRDIPVCYSGLGPKEDAELVERYCDNCIYTTKYSMKPWTLQFFLYKMLWEQFQRKANIYFLIIGSVQMIDGISPTGRFTTISTLVLVLFFSFLKSGFEDFSRYRRDRETNSRRVSVLKSFSNNVTKWKDCTYADIRVGDIVRVDNVANEHGERNNGIPCDMILLTSSEDDGTCYVETANLDGETNLKMRKASDLTHIRRIVPATEQDINELHSLRNPKNHPAAREVYSDNDEKNNSTNSDNNNKQHHIVTYDNLDELCIMVQEKYRDMQAECEHPNMNLYRFSGNLRHPDWAPGGIQIENNQTLYRGCSLRKVQWAVGVCCFTGHETKVMRNASVPPHKASRVERMVNKLMFVVLFLQLILCVVGAVGTALTADSSDWYLASDSIDNFALNTFLAFLTFVILTNNFIPISLYVSLEFIKFYQGRLMEQDLCMYYPPKDMPAMAKATDLNEELGQINYCFCDKTGTLTRNVMHFLKFGVGGEIYGLGTTEIGRAAAKRKGIPITDERPERIINSNDPFWDPRMVDNRWVSLNNAEEIRQFFMALAICHTVVVDNGSYEAESPDEEALVRAARKFGYTFVHRGSDHVLIETKNGSHHRVEILEVIHFSSDRKRMSIVCKLPQGDIVIYSKGAETTMFPRLRDGTDFDTAERIQNSFAEEGLRPLVVASKSLEPAFAKSWLANMKEARSIIGNDKEREDQIADLAVEVECDLRLVGITGVEDKLQDQVPETIVALRKAGVSVWMLTGDKRETAINIGFACDFLHKEMKIVEVFGYKPKDEDDLVAKLQTSADIPAEEDVACVIDGHTLAIVLDKEKNRETFYNLVKRCSSVICCRVSPKQKAEVVEIMKYYSGDSVTTLAIGDGANDVPMIQAAHVGVGISGMEGQQAANSADFAIGQFKYLHRLMIVHGRVNYSRLTLVINYFFYKNALLVMTQFWYCLFNLFTGQSLYEQWSLASWNFIFTSVPVLLVGILDRDILNTDKLHEYPQLYKRGLANEALNFYVFTGWILIAVYHSAICFFGVFFGSQPPAGSLTATNGIELGLDGAGVTLYTVIIFVATIKFAFHIKSFTAYHWLTLVGSVAAWIGFLVVYSSVDSSISSTMYGILENVGFILMPWLFALMMVVLCLFPDLIYKYGLFNFHKWCGSYHPLLAREAVMMADAEDSIAAVRVPKELLRRRQAGHSKKGAAGDDSAKEKLFKSAAEEAVESLHTKQGLLLDFVDQEVEDAYREFTFGELKRYKIGLAISSIISSLIVVNFVTSSDVKQIEVGGWALFCVACWIGFGIVMLIPHTTLRNFIHYVMSALLLVGFSGMSIANLAAAQRSPATHPVTSGVILLGIIVLIRPPLVHAVMYVFMNTVLYIIWYQIFKVEQWSINELLVRVLELIIVAVTSLVALAATERFTRKVFVSQLQVKRAVKAVTAEEERSMLLLQNVFPAAIVQEVREVKRPLADFSCTFHEASMLNSDIVKFTQFSSTKEPHVVVEMLNRMFTKFDAHAAVLGLEKIKTIGDAYLCASGIPVPDPFHHRKIISMGRKMVHSMFEMNKEGLPSLPNLDVHIRVGSATGPIRAGVVGLQKACFDVFGEVSEESEHMESSGIPDRLQVTEELYEAVKEFYQFEQLKNKDGNMGYFVIDDGVEPFMGLKSQIEENKQKQLSPFSPLDKSGDLNNNNKNFDNNNKNGSDNSGRNSVASGDAGSRRMSRTNSMNASSMQTNFGGEKVTASRRKKKRDIKKQDVSFAEDGSPLETNSTLLTGQHNYDDEGDDHHHAGSTSPDHNTILSDDPNAMLKEGDYSDDDGGAPKISPPRARPLTNSEKQPDLYKFLEDSNVVRQELVTAYAGFDGEKNTFDLNFEFDRAEEEFRMYYQRLAESKVLIETVQAILIFGICALLVGLHLSEVDHWFVIVQVVVSLLHVFLVITYVVLKRMRKTEEAEARKKSVFNFDNEDGYNTALGNAGTFNQSQNNNSNSNNTNTGAGFESSASDPMSPSPTKSKNNKRKSKRKNHHGPAVSQQEQVQQQVQQQKQQQQQQRALSAENSDFNNGGMGERTQTQSDGVVMSVDDGLTQEDLLESDESDDEEVDPSSPQFNLNRINTDDNFHRPDFCNHIRMAAFLSGLLAFTMPVYLTVLVDDGEIEIIMVFVMLASVVYITSFLHLRFTIKVIVLIAHLCAVSGAFFTRVLIQRVDGIRLTEDGGNYLAILLCYVLCIIAGYQTESNVRSAFAVAKKVVFQNAELLSAIDLCDKLLKNVLPVSIVRRMIADPTKAIVDEVDEASVLFLYVDGVRPHTEAEALGKETGKMVNEMNEFLFIMDCLCMYHHVEKIKTVPYLVVSGCPEPIARHCNRLAALARDVIHFADAYNAAYGTNIRVKCGLHAGKVTAGVLGATKFIYDVFGDTVNFASRLASSSSWGVVQCSDHARKLIEGFSEVIDRGEIELKGKGMQKVYTIDLDTINLKKAEMVVKMTHASEIDVNSFREFDPHMKIYNGSFMHHNASSTNVTTNSNNNKDSFSGSPGLGMNRNRGTSSEMQNRRSSTTGPSLAAQKMQKRENETHNPLAGMNNKQSTQTVTRHTGAGGADRFNRQSSAAHDDVELDNVETVVSGPSSPRSQPRRQ